MLTLLKRALVNDMMNVFQGGVTNSTKLKMAIYSGHDTTLMPLLSAFQIWDGIWVPYASVASFELWQSSAANRFYVRVIYNGKVMQVPGCDNTLCDYETFAAVANKITLTNPAVQCQVDKKAAKSKIILRHHEEVAATQN